MEQSVYFAQDAAERRKQELLSSILVDNTHSFYLEYNRKTGEMQLDTNYAKYIHVDWSAIDLQHEETLKHIVFRPDNKNFIELLSGEGLCRDARRTTKVRLYTDAFTYEWYRMTCAVMDDLESTEDFDKLFVVFSNIDVEMNALHTMNMMDIQDRLTGLPTFHNFIDETNNLLEQYPEEEFAVIRMDIEQFRRINQIYGTIEGNNILRFIAVKIQECIEAEECGTYCHMANDVFCICIPGCQEDINRIVEYLQREIQYYPLHFDLIISCGIYIMTKEDRLEKTSVTTAVDRALMAQKTIKQNYMKHIAYYDSQIRDQDIIEQFILAEMKNSLKRKEYIVYYQPKCDMLSGEIIGAEALVRWNHPEKGMISPGDFVPVFERNAFIKELDLYVLGQVCRDIQEWLATGMRIVPISVNVSRVDLYECRLLQKIIDCVDGHNIPHEYIQFEITESAYITESDRLLDFVSGLRKHDFSVLMDDFGSGYSSLNSLREINVDILKVDIHFLPTGRNDVRANIILQAIADMTHNLGIHTVVEGVETLEQTEFLISIGYQVAQGFYFYRPIPREQFEQALVEKPIPLEIRRQEAEKTMEG